MVLSASSEYVPIGSADAVAVLAITLVSRNCPIAASECGVWTGWKMIRTGAKASVGDWTKTGWAVWLSISSQVKAAAQSAAASTGVRLFIRL
jgi:hypothetical protein